MYRNISILEYLHAQNMPSTYAAMREELQSDYEPNPKSKFSNLLEKKWISVIRLQKKVRPFLLFLASLFSVIVPCILCQS